MTVLVRQQPTSAATVDRPKLTVVLPIYNEEESIPPLLEALVGELDGLYDSYEIIAVNDGSRDGSQQALEAAAEHYPQDRVHQDYQRDYNTRPALRLIRPLRPGTTQ